jgi:squalene synthase HpnC
MRQRHYENFPVASWLLPKHLRHPVRLIYAFARQADDIADEGDLSPQRRLDLLEDFRAELRRIEAGIQPEKQLFRQLRDVVREHRLPLEPFSDLLDAFSQDVVKTRYANFGELMEYCRKSANPVGRLLLALYGDQDRRDLAYADAICSSLQLINFLQDVAADYGKGRIYLPEDEMDRYGITQAQIARKDAGGMWQPFMLYQIERARKMLQSGAPLARSLGGRIGMELRMIVMGGETILRKLHGTRGDVFHHRPVLTFRDWPYMFFRALRAK